MKRSVAVFLGIAFLLAASAPPAAAQCQTINAVDDSVLVPTGPDCPSPVGFCASSDRVQGNHGFRGTFFFGALAFDPIPFAGVGRVTSGTGRFAGATGDVFTTGRTHESGTAFTTETRLEICYAP